MSLITIVRRLHLGHVRRALAHAEARREIVGPDPYGDKRIARLRRASLLLRARLLMAARTIHAKRDLLVVAATVAGAGPILITDILRRFA